MLIREDLRPFNVMIHDPSKESFDILAGTFRDEEVEKNRDRSLENFAIWFFKNSTNKFLSLSFSLESVSRNRLNREGPLKCSSSSAKVQSRFSRVDSRAYRYILQLMANGKSILIEILAMSFTVSDIILSDRREHDWTGSWLRAY